MARCRRAFLPRLVSTAIAAQSTNRPMANHHALACRRQSGFGPICAHAQRSQPCRKDWSDTISAWSAGGATHLKSATSCICPRNRARARSAEPRPPTFPRGRTDRSAVVGGLSSAAAAMLASMNVKRTARARALNDFIPDTACRKKRQCRLRPARCIEEMRHLPAAAFPARSAPAARSRGSCDFDPRSPPRPPAPPACAASAP